MWRAYPPAETSPGQMETRWKPKLTANRAAAALVHPPIPQEFALGHDGGIS